jgi:hypothetical protein
MASAYPGLPPRADQILPFQGGKGGTAPGGEPEGQVHAKVTAISGQSPQFRPCRGTRALYPNVLSTETFASAVFTALEGPDLKQPGA